MKVCILQKLCMDFKMSCNTNSIFNLTIWIILLFKCKCLYEPHWKVELNLKYLNYNKYKHYILNYVYGLEFEVNNFIIVYVILSFSLTGWFSSSIFPVFYSHNFRKFFTGSYSFTYSFVMFPFPHWLVSIALYF